MSPDDPSRPLGKTASRRFPGVLAALVGVAIVSLGCTSRDAADSDPIDRFILVTIDTLRADHLGFYGYPRSTSPFLDQMAADGVVFDNAIASIPSTVPSHASLFTGLYPLQHDVRTNRQRLSDSLVTAAELFAARGFETAAFVSVHLMKASNLHQGFATFDSPATTNYELYRSGSETVDAALAWLDGKSHSDGLFLWVHLFDPHIPYRDHPTDLQALSSAERKVHYRFLLEEHRATPIGKMKQFVDRIEKYDTEIRYVDLQLKRLYEGIGRDPSQANTLWVVTADHGEGLGNHRLVGHQRNIYTEQIRVPLVFHFTPAKEPRMRVSETVRHIDVLPTLLDYAGIDSVAIPYSDRFLGRSLAQRIESRSETLSPIPAFSQRTLYSEEVIRRNKSIGAGTKYAWTEDQYRLVHWTEGPDELFDLRTDPYEQKNLLRRRPREGRRMQRSLEAALREMQPVLQNEESQAVDDKTRTLLKALGYEGE